jgi:hypothetical protein
VANATYTTVPVDTAGVKLAQNADTLRRATFSSTQKTSKGITFEVIHGETSSFFNFPNFEA